MELLTPRLRLREFVEDDWKAVFAYQRDPRYLRFNPWTERQEEAARLMVSMFVEWQGAEPRHKYQLAVTLRESGELIGNCGIRKTVPEALQAETGYELNPDYWNHGYATEADRAMVAFGFRELKLHRVWAHCIAENKASAHVLEKVGMRLEGRLREDEWMKGRWWDTLIYGILEEEFFP